MLSSRLSAAHTLLSHSEVSREGMTLSWTDVSVYVQCREEHFLKSTSVKHKKIIDNVSGVVEPGQLVALIGASGAGKSTLMAALAFQTSDGTVVDGDIRVNGRPIGPFVRRLAGYMDQENIFVETLTVVEHLNFMASLKLDRRICRAERNRVIGQLLVTLGLSGCANSHIGSTEAKAVLSGGERKRLSFATACLDDPVLLFCDEPTTGLDSCSAHTIVSLMQDFAINRNKTIVCSIHQPSSELFTMFHQVVLLAGGRTAYIGSTDGALSFFSSMGHDCPEAYNPAEFLIKTLASEANWSICDTFSASEQAKEVFRKARIGAAFDDELLEYRMNAYKPPFWLSKVYLVTYRTILDIVRNPKVMQIGLFQKMMIGIMVGLCFAGSLQLTQPGVQATQGVIFTMVTENTFGPMYAMLNLYPAQMPLFFHDYRKGLYSASVFYIAKLISILPGLVMDPLLFTAILYILAGFHFSWSAFTMTLLISVLCVNVSAACGCLFSSAFRSVPIAMTYLIPFDYAIMITAGNFIKLSTLGPLFSWIQYISWMKYSNEALSIVHWQNINNITCESHDQDLPCLRTGDAVLGQYSFSSEHLWRNVYALLSLYCTFHVLAFLFLLNKLNKHMVR